MTTPAEADAKEAGREQGRESAQRTYDRRRARAAADTLAVIPPNRWDDHTRQVIATLATISSPSRIDDLLDAFDGDPAEQYVVIDTADAGERVRTTIDAYDGVSCKHGVPGYRGVETCAEGGHDQ